MSRLGVALERVAIVVAAIALAAVLIALLSGFFTSHDAPAVHSQTTRSSSAHSALSRPPGPDSPRPTADAATGQPRTAMVMRVSVHSRPRLSDSSISQTHVVRPR